MKDLEWRNNIDELKKIKKTDISKNEIYRALKKSILNVLPREKFGIYCPTKTSEYYYLEVLILH